MKKFSEYINEKTKSITNALAILINTSEEYDNITDLLKQYKNKTRLLETIRKQLINHNHKNTFMEIENKYKNGKKMYDFFEKRTKNHIRLVRKYCKKIEEYDPKRFAGLIERGEIHDQSKYKAPELEPYIYITWDYRCKTKNIYWSPSKDMQERMNKASEHHVHNKSNRHHPESTSPTKGNTINKKNRDKPPEKMIDATNMTDLDIGEMLADWWAMSEEKKDSSPKKWADSNVNIRWKFTNRQTKLIYDLVENIS